MENLTESALQKASVSERSAQSTLETAKPQPAGELKRSEGRLRREGQQRVWIQDGDMKVFLSREILGDAFNSMPGDKTEAVYRYDEVNGQRRMWRVQRKLKGL